MRTRGAGSAWNRIHTVWGDVPKLPEESSDVPRPIRYGARQTSDIKVGSQRRGGVATAPTDQHVYQEIPENRTLRVPGSGGPRPTFTEIVRQPAGRRRVAEPTETSKPQTGHDWNPAPMYARPRRCCHHRASPHVCRTSLGGARATRHPPACGSLRSPLEVRGSTAPKGGGSPNRPRQVSLRRPWDVSRPTGWTALGVHRGDRSAFPPSARTERRWQRDLDQRNHTNAVPPPATPRAFGPSATQRGRVARPAPKHRSCRSAMTFDEKPTENIER